MGSTSLITNLDGEVVQHVEYIPFGEVFIEERNNTWNTPFLFNAKELDEETGLYYYGARYYDPRTSLWLSVDPLWEEKLWLSPYAYCSNNPLNRIDPDGASDYYYNESGEQIYFVKNQKPDRSFFIKTSQTTDEMYGSHDNPQKGNANGISKAEAAMTELGIKEYGDVNNPKIQKNLVEVDMESLKAAYNSIGDNGKGGENKENNREYSGNFNGMKGVKDLAKSEVKDPSKKEYLVTSGNNDFHSHPSGTKNGIGWLQPPSKQDINVSGKTNQYVFGMRDKKIYIFNKTGVIASIPLSILKK